MIFKDRKDAGKQLAAEVFNYINYGNYIILGLPRGGIPVAYEVAKILKMPLDIFLVTKIGCPGNEEFAIGAATLDGNYTINHEAIKMMNITDEIIQPLIKKAQDKLKKRDDLYHQNLKVTDLKNKKVILIDDGIATGATMGLAVQVLKKQGINQIIVATPTCSKSAYDELEGEVFKIISLIIKESFNAVGEYYQNFFQTTDEEVLNLLKSSKRKLTPIGNSISS